jgi:hypothetical protein
VGGASGRELGKGDQPLESSAWVTRVDGAHPRDATSDREDEGQRLRIADLADYQALRSHTQGGCDERAQRDFLAADAATAGLEVGDVGVADASFTSLLDDDDARGLGEGFEQRACKGCLTRTRQACNQDRRAGAHRVDEEAG